MLRVNHEVYNSLSKKATVVSGDTVRHKKKSLTSCPQGPPEPQENPRSLQQLYVAVCIASRAIVDLPAAFFTTVCRND